MPMWNPWRGCHKYSNGCLHCYIHKGDLKRGVDTNQITKTNNFYAPIEKKKNNTYKIPSGQKVFLGFSTDFLIEEGDSWRPECFKMMKERSDLHFLFLTKRIERFLSCIPEDWGSGYENITVCCTVEDQESVEKRLALFSQLPIKHKNISCQPLLESINIEPYLDNIELLVLGGESDTHGRPLNYDWVLSVREQCVRQNVKFEFRQCGTHFIKDGISYKINVRQLCSQARKANINT